MPARVRHYDSPTYKRNRDLILSGFPSCSLCGGAGADTADHILPLSRGGTHELSNLRPAHRGCNSTRGNRVRTRYRSRW